MNKTVNINLAGIFFHIDEDAYMKLQRYLDAIKRSFTDSQGRDEIIADIEARIAELFNEKIKDERQVIGHKEVDAVIEVMGQPEDYQIDEDIFEDEPKTTAQVNPHRSKSLFRDTTNSYVGGVSSGLGHYLAIDPVWIRLAWILFTIFSSGGFILIYIALWIFVPEAKTTADKLAMKGKPVNINTIEKKIKEGFNDVADSVKNVDYQKYSSKVKSSSTSFFDALGDVLIFLFKIAIKFIGVLLMIVAGVTLISLFFGLFAVSTFGLIDTPLNEHLQVLNHSNVSIWLIATFTFLAVGIPFFFLFILGLKIMIPNLKSIGTTAKLGLLALWIISTVGLAVIGIRQATLENYTAEVISEEIILPVSKSDTLQIKMQHNRRYIRHLSHRNDYKIRKDSEGNQVIVLQDIRLYVKESNDTTARMSIVKRAEGFSYDNASNAANALLYKYEFKNNVLTLDGHALTAIKNKYRDQEIQVILTLPQNITIIADKNTTSYNNSWNYDDYISLSGKEGNYLTLSKGELSCEDCPENDQNGEWKYKGWNDDEAQEYESNEDQEFNLKIDEDGLELNNEPVKVKIDENGIEIKTKN
ncbi:PspC domain-containing protein [Aquimarina sp. W85]|uniref:PspC domain-containing protein n=1 Tax=Aquimarina rhodophyticola TaxID=3342246 RepID=UPI00366AE207